ncbi:MAG: hypothetical protein FWB96_00865 [Defluviitaleaceae bacterium]|nr:hypothetical protein [Defluviitaleaceae bacterium]MCL2262759.1 hypothetical protein [Defluviitaleaceae bacterium]
MDYLVIFGEFLESIMFVQGILFGLLVGITITSLITVILVMLYLKKRLPDIVRQQRNADE